MVEHGRAELVGVVCEQGDLDAFVRASIRTSSWVPVNAHTSLPEELPGGRRSG
jgi:hypothetical protein